MSTSIPRHEIRYNDWYSAHRPVGAKEGYGDHHTQYGTNPDGSTYEVRPWKHPDNPEFAKLHPEYARLLRQQRDQRTEEARLKAREPIQSAVPRCSPAAALSPAAREVIAMEQRLQKIREGKASAGLGCGISKWELMAHQLFHSNESRKRAAAEKAAQDQAWLNEVRGRTAAKEAAEVNAGVMQERHGAGFTARVRKVDGASVGAEVADRAAISAQVLLDFFRGDLMRSVLTNMPRGGTAPGRGRGEVTAYRSLSNVAQVLERGRADGWHETHELKLTLNGGDVVVSYHSKHSRISSAQLESAGHGEAAVALRELASNGIALHIEPR